jgi:chromosome segregation ATPase
MLQSNVTRDALRNGPAAQPTAVLEDGAPLAESEDVETLRGENAALRAKVDELEQMLGLAAQDGEERWAERQREYESLLEEKSEVIRGLHQKVADLRERASSAPAPGPVDKGEPTPDRQELLRLKRELEQERAQMARDEESMMAQMRQMEMALAKDRADLARQRVEVQRLQGDLKHDLESASRDGGLRERLTALQRRGASPAPARPTVNQDTPPPGQSPPGRSGLFRRIFGAGQ